VVFSEVSIPQFYPRDFIERKFQKQQRPFGIFVQFSLSKIHFVYNCINHYTAGCSFPKPMLQKNERHANATFNETCF